MEKRLLEELGISEKSDDLHHFLKVSVKIFNLITKDAMISGYE